MASVLVFIDISINIFFPIVFNIPIAVCEENLVEHQDGDDDYEVKEGKDAACAPNLKQHRMLKPSFMKLSDTINQQLLNSTLQKVFWVVLLTFTF